MMHGASCKKQDQRKLELVSQIGQSIRQFPGSGKGRFREPQFDVLLIAGPSGFL